MYTLTALNVNGNTQSKVNKRKINKRKEDYIKVKREYLFIHAHEG